MGFAVVHLEKAKGTDSGMSAHIERTIDPKNADKERTHLNRELIEFPDGVENRTQAIQHRLDNAGLTRKVGSNQVRAVRVMLSGTHEDMIKIESEGRLDEWCRDNLDWLRQTYGRDNVVSAVLHLDEKTPHIHATVVPIVTTERVKRKREESVKKTYRKKKPSARLCCDEVMGRGRLEKYQDDYAAAMAKYELQRGRRGSEARHVSTSEYYKDLQQQSESLQTDISQLLEQQEAAQKELSATKSDISKENFKNSVADVGSKIINGASSLLGTSKVKRLETENTQLKSDIADVRTEIEQVKEESQQRIDNYTRDVNREYNRRLDEFNRKEKQFEKEKSHLYDTINKIFSIIPDAQEKLRIEELCRVVKFSAEMIKLLFCRDKVGFKGRLYSEEHDRYFETEHSEARIERNPNNPNKLRLAIDGKDIADWFKERYKQLRESLGYGQSEARQSRGFRR
ncbi:MAG: MobV family relaxase [Rikenellaceae bacterium]